MTRENSEGFTFEFEEIILSKITSVFPPKRDGEILKIEFFIVFKTNGTKACRMGMLKS